MPERFLYLFSTRCTAPSSYPLPTLPLRSFVCGDVMIVTDIARRGTSSRGIIAKPHLAHSRDGGGGDPSSPSFGRYINASESLFLSPLRMLVDSVEAKTQLWQVLSHFSLAQKFQLCMQCSVSEQPDAGDELVGWEAGGCGGGKLLAVCYMVVAFLNLHRGRRQPPPSAHDLTSCAKNPAGTKPRLPSFFLPSVPSASIKLNARSRQR